jgi:hypothetical protein
MIPIAFSLITIILAQEDLFSSPKYQLELKPISEANFKTDRFECFIPPAFVTEKELQLADLTDRLKNMSCLYHIIESRYWSYEFCSMKHALQFHPLSQTEQKYLLGTFTKQKSQKLDYEIIDGAKQPILIQEWSGGTMCDLSLEPRRTRVEYHCATEEKVIVRETSSCYYLFSVSTPRVCIGLNNVSVIKCSIIGDDSSLSAPSIEEMIDAPVVGDVGRSVMKVSNEIKLSKQKTIVVVLE